MQTYDADVQLLLADIFEAEQKAREHKEEARKAEDYARKMRMYVMEKLASDGVKSMDAGDYNLCVKATPPVLIISTLEGLPDEYCRIKRDPDKPKIKKALQAGVKLNWAQLSEPGRTLQIKHKEAK